MTFEKVQMRFVARLEEEREKRGMTKEAFAAFCGISPTTLNYTLARGGLPTLYTAMLIAEACGLTLDQLTREESTWQRTKNTTG